MALRLNHPEADHLARELARETGEGLTEVVIVALRERLTRLRHARRTGLVAEILRIGKECAALPVIDARPAEEILSYADDGLPH